MLRSIASAPDAYNVVTQKGKAVGMMNMKQCKRWGAALIACACVSMMLFALCLGVAAENATEEQNKQVDITAPIVSPALSILAAKGDMAVATLIGNDYYFSEQVFARSLNVDVSALDYITVHKLPSVADGELLMGSTRVQEGQVISAANLKMLCYVAAEETAESRGSFTFSPDGASYEIACNVYVLKDINYSPTVSIASGEALSVSTHKNFVGYGTLTAYDPEGDELTFEVVRAPKHGLLVMTDASCGEYVYLPRIGYKGEDSFTYVVRDIYGNYSASAKVSVQVSEPSVSLTYADMVGRRDYNAALTMAESGIMQGTAQDDKMYFYPEQTVSRLDFLTMAMQTMGVGSVPSVSDTGFADDADIPTDAKGYVSAAYSLGYIKGTPDEQGNLCFSPSDTITRAEAAVILRRMVDAEEAELTPAFADSSDIPAWASEAISTLSSLGVMTPSGGAISPNVEVTRGQTAMMLSALQRVVNDK